MPRFIRLDAAGPIRIDPSQFPRDAAGELKPIWVCACGLSSKMPFCDGTHKTACPKEEMGRVYTYDPVTKQVIDTRME